MRTLIQTVAGAAQFTGAGNAGFLDFADLGPLTRMDPQIHPIITNIAVENLFAEDLVLDCFLLAPGEDPATSTVRITIDRETIAGFSKGGCRISVPCNAARLPWTLRLVTTGKTQSATLVVSYDLGSAISA